MNKTYTLAYTEDRQVAVPERRFYLDKLPNGWTTKALRGYAYVEAVFDLDGECQGWVELPERRV